MMVFSKFISERVTKMSDIISNSYVIRTSVSSAISKIACLILTDKSIKSLIVKLMIEGVCFYLYRNDVWFTIIVSFDMLNNFVNLLREFITSLNIDLYNLKRGDCDASRSRFMHMLISSIFNELGKIVYIPDVVFDVIRFIFTDQYFISTFFSSFISLGYWSLCSEGWYYLAAISIYNIYYQILAISDIVENLKTMGINRSDIIFVAKFDQHGILNLNTVVVESVFHSSFISLCDNNSIISNQYSLNFFYFSFIRRHARSLSIVGINSYFFDSNVDYLSALLFIRPKRKYFFYFQNHVVDISFFNVVGKSFGLELAEDGFYIREVLFGASRNENSCKYLLDEDIEWISIPQSIFEIPKKCVDFLFSKFIFPVEQYAKSLNTTLQNVGKGTIALAYIHRITASMMDLISEMFSRFATSSMAYYSRLVTFVLNCYDTYKMFLDNLGLKVSFVSRSQSGPTDTILAAVLLETLMPSHLHKLLKDLPLYTNFKLLDDATWVFDFFSFIIKLPRLLIQTVTPVGFDAHSKIFVDFFMTIEDLFPFGELGRYSYKINQYILEWTKDQRMLSKNEKQEEMLLFDKKYTIFKRALLERKMVLPSFLKENDKIYCNLIKKN